MNGALQVQSGGGPIQLDRIAGPVTARTAGGPISIGTLAGSVRCTTAGGEVRAESIRGEAVLETAGGDITVNEVGGPLLAATAALNAVSPDHAELFAATRLATTHPGMYGAIDLDPADIRALLERALP